MENNKNRSDLPAQSKRVFDSYLANGFTSAGFFKDCKILKQVMKKRLLVFADNPEGVYAILQYLQYEKEHGRKHPEWETKMKHMLDMFLRLQQGDGSFPPVSLKMILV